MMIGGDLGEVFGPCVGGIRGSFFGEGIGGRHARGNLGKVGKDVWFRRGSMASGYCGDSGS